MGKVSIQMTNDKKRYVIGGCTYARISDIARAGSNPYLEQWKKRIGEVEAERIAREAAKYGDLVHEITMWNDLGKKKKVDRMLINHEFLLSPLLAWQNWVSKYVRKWLMRETVVWSARWGCAGKIDGVPIIIGDNDPSIIDIKTGGLWDTTGIQLAGYMVVYNEKAKKKAKRRLAISIPRKNPGTLTLKEFTEEKYVEEFKSKAELFKSMNG